MSDGVGPMCAGCVRMNMLPLMPKLTDEDRENIALAMRRYDPKHPLKTNFPHYLKAAAAFDTIALSKFDTVMAALREAAPYIPKSVARSESWNCSSEEISISHTLEFSNFRGEG